MILIIHQFNARFYAHLHMDGFDMITMTYVLEVKASMKAAKLEFLTSMLWKVAEGACFLK